MSTVEELKEQALDAVEGLYSACERDVEKLQDKVIKLEEQVTELEGQVEAVRERCASPEWGNCRRGCPPAFINSRGFCSPACAMGAPRGEFVTVADKTPDWDADRGDGFNSRGYEAGRGIYHDPMG